MSIFKLGNYCVLKRTCTNCRKEKHGSEFYFNMFKCKDCYLEIEKIEKPDIDKLQRKLDRISQWESIDIGLDNLNKDSPITFFKSDLTSASTITYKKALELYDKKLISVYKHNEVYRLYGENKFLKQMVCLTSKYTCHYCGGFGDTVDHIIPVAKGGLWTESNLVCACKDCNIEKADMDYDEFIKRNGNNPNSNKIKYKGKRKIKGYNKHGIPIRG